MKSIASIWLVVFGSFCYQKEEKKILLKYQTYLAIGSEKLNFDPLPKRDLTRLCF